MKKSITIVFHSFLVVESRTLISVPNLDYSYVIKRGATTCLDEQNNMFVAPLCLVWNKWFSFLYNEFLI